MWPMQRQVGSWCPLPGACHQVPWMSACAAVSSYGWLEVQGTWTTPNACAEAQQVLCNDGT